MPATCGVSENGALDVFEDEMRCEIAPGLARIAEHLVLELGMLMRGDTHALSRTLLDGNPAFPARAR